MIAGPFSKYRDLFVIWLFNLPYKVLKETGSGTFYDLCTFEI